MLSTKVRAKLVRFVNGKLSLDDFIMWLDDFVWDTTDGTLDDRVLLQATEGALYDIQDGRTSMSGARERLRDYVDEEDQR